MNASRTALTDEVEGYIYSVISSLQPEILKLDALDSLQSHITKINQPETCLQGRPLIYVL